ncbi:hypothetical protein B0487_1398 [Bifidobacterium adolescentis]|uniref:Uncharacterized protein n=4 Tax=Bifidobacterium adolescentis TaxID=1680 RepID=A0A1X2Z275_BIFAD|nr:hypothetical protein [Bifidobacterium adolescentis]OSG88476.1 hypothetical protein B0487_1398 [Bifidobacterium adolescentis]
MRLNSESIETILERFDRRDDADADYVMAHWREAVDVYEHDGSMLDLDNIVRLETVLGDRIGYDAYHRINSTMEDLGEWLEQGLLVREASDGARRTAGSGGVPLNWIRGRLDEWIRTAPIDADARYTWTAGLADQSERDVMRVWAEDELAQVVETTTGTSREEGTAAWSSIRARTSSPNPTWNGRRDCCRKATSNARTARTRIRSATRAHSARPRRHAERKLVDAVHRSAAAEVATLHVGRHKGRGAPPPTTKGRNMPQTMLTVRGNLGANPDYLPEKTMEDGAILPSKLQAVVYENRRVRTADGGWTDDPRGPVKTTVQLFGNAADTVRRIDMRQGDPVIAGGSIAEPAAYASSKDGQPDARNVINAQWLVYDSILYQRRKERAAEAEQRAGSSPSETQPATGEERP